MSARPPVGLLLANTGTPDAPDARAVRRYLAEFLADERVLDMNAAGRWLLLHLVILPFRPQRSAHAYRQIWTERGSPLLVHSRALADAVRGRLGAGWAVELGMRYGNPSIGSALERLRAANVSRVVALPLFPHYATSSAGTTAAAILRAAAEPWVTTPVTTLGTFYDDPGYLGAFEAVARPVLERARPDHLLFSFHSVPERHLRRGDPAGHCLSAPDCCERRGPAQRHCYRAQCFESARLLASRLGLAPGAWSVSFQSRLGKTPWIRPRTDERVRELAGAGVMRLAVSCPSFVADCLESLEEIGLRAKEDFLAHGGQEFTLVPALNSAPEWVEAVASLARSAAGADAPARAAAG